MLERVRQQEPLPDGLARSSSEFSSQFLVLEQLNNSGGRLFDRRNKKTVFFILDLMPDPTGIASDHRRTFPHRFGNSKPKSFTDRFL